MTIKPNFFIVGAPRCGTTALSEYLRTHPSVFMSPGKEPHYFSEDLPGIRWATTAEEYKQYFEETGSEHERIGEASVLYLYSRVAISRIRDEVPDAKLIVMLRDYVGFLRSYHAKLLYNLDEDVLDLERAWGLQPVRFNGQQVPPHCREPALLQYRPVASFGEQVKRMLATFPAEQVLVVLFDDFVADPVRSYRQVVQFLGLPDDGRREFPLVNQRAVHRSRVVAALTQRPPLGLVAAGQAAKRMLGFSRTSVLRRVRALNRSTSTLAPLDQSFVQELRHVFRDDGAMLSDMIGRDLSSWVR